MCKQDIVIGTWCEIPSAYLVHVLAKTGLDFVILDMEHSVFNFETIQNAVFAAHSENLNVFVRVSALQESQVKRALDTGADGLVFHQIRNIEDIDKIIEYSKFSPLGKRGFNPYISACGYTSVDLHFLEMQNQRTKIVIILENKEIFNHLDDIVSRSEIDALYVGQYDLSIEYDVPGQISHPLILECMNLAKEKAKSFGKQVGAMVHNQSDAQNMIKNGFDFIVYKTDTGVIHSAYSDFIKGVKANETF